MILRTYLDLENLKKFLKSKSHEYNSPFKLESKPKLSPKTMFLVSLLLKIDLVFALNDFVFLELTFE